MVSIAGSVSLTAILAGMARARPVFHSEADMQHAFAWEAHNLDPHLQVRLETHPEPDVRLDLLISSFDTDRHMAIELKYLTAHWTGAYAGEAFALKNHRAQDIRAYDVVKDACRLERIVGQRSNWNCIFVAITNDPTYWRPTTHGRQTNADAFRIYHGVTLTGRRAWGPNTGAGTMKNRTEAVELTGTYELSWSDYSRLPGTGGEFRVLVVEVTGPSDSESRWC